MTNFKATDIISKHQYLTLSRFRQGTVVAIPRKEGETETTYRDRCRLNPSCIGMAMTDALPSQFVVVELIPHRDTIYYDTSTD